MGRGRDFASSKGGMITIIVAAVLVGVMTFAGIGHLTGLFRRNNQCPIKGLEGYWYWDISTTTWVTLRVSNGEATIYGLATHHDESDINELIKARILGEYRFVIPHRANSSYIMVLTYRVSDNEFVQQRFNRAESAGGGTFLYDGAPFYSIPQAGLQMIYRQLEGTWEEMNPFLDNLLIIEGTSVTFNGYPLTNLIRFPARTVVGGRPARERGFWFYAMRFDGFEGDRMLMVRYNPVTDRFLVSLYALFVGSAHDHAEFVNFIYDGESFFKNWLIDMAYIRVVE